VLNLTSSPKLFRPVTGGQRDAGVARLEVDVLQHEIGFFDLEVALVDRSADSMMPKSCAAAAWA
jgi:hypothetical protein